MGQLCSGMSASQYERFCEFVDIGTVSQQFRDSAAITVSNVIGLIIQDNQFKTHWPRKSPHPVKTAFLL